MAAKSGVALVADPSPEAAGKKKKYYRKNVEFFKLLEKIKLWPSRSGMLHGIKSIKITGDIAEVVTHCDEKFIVWNSRTSRAARWLRNKWCVCACKKCKIPAWKLEKYTSTMMTQKWGSNL
ncbi:pyrrolysine--tRNA(Pyl) ligase small subunit [Sporomusa acidovorans]|uniref:Pyrolysyl-tRNA synthetase n=1 Tax=Sporomusa acidovorans (strain ATCC 49682 / DSM 3132 / Mol) TaxID=1123286 RepID=A0ABZ3IW84_SPOA4|nr:pyrrolysine--tRNA(Pyl) ligase small subunit [Sporomusa acidovorans]OZC24038.1 pyrolysyl-tRNA ligase [Sporomusa acidovorans DSM 3132]SDF58267.1 pyrrolysyl-tRNA synthetase, N-terminal region [Sporomusa acidovorans]